IYYKLNIKLSKEKAQDACSEAARRDSPILIELYKSGVLGKKSEENLFDLISCFNELPRESAAGGLLTVWHNMGYGKYVHRNKLDAGKLQILLLLAKNEDNPLALLSRLDELREIILAHRNSSEVSLTLSTIHSSKGLEYDNVYLLDVLDGILPFKAEGELEKDEMRLFQEERRLFYVGVTRARHGLNLFSVAGEASSFVSEAEKLLRGTAMGEKSAPASEMAKTHLVASELNPGDRVKHKFFGPGLVTAIEGSHISVRFDESGETKTFLSGAAPMKKE
ncbi:MAG: hypothetical protein MJ067_05860, partial [Oscillospiraceae bacterium]|nr:hypothetical protein [Oscillospiraceae bacterium]